MESKRKKSSPKKSATRCKDIRSALKTNPFTEPPRKYKGKKGGRERIRKSTKDVTSLKCIRLQVDENHDDINPQRRMHTRNGYSREEEDTQTEVIKYTDKIFA